MSDYLRYKDDFKKNLILNLVSAGILFVGILLLLFCPCFKTNWADEDFADIVADTIPKKVYVEMYTILLDDNLDTNISFSLKDELSATIDNLNNETLKNYENYDRDTQTFGVIMLGTFFGAALLSSLIQCFAYIKKLLSLDDYALERYDLIMKSDAESSNASAVGRGAALVVVVCIFGGLFGTAYFAAIFFAEHVAFSYILGLSGITGWLVVVLIVLAAGIGVAYYAGTYNKKVRLDIMRKEYGADKADK